MAKKSFSDQLEQLTTLHKVLIFVLGLGLILGGGWYLLLGPKLGEMEKVQGQIKKLKKNIKKNKKTAAKLEKRKKELKSKKNEFAYAKQLLPQDAQALERLLASFEKLGNDQGVDFLLFKPGGEKKQNFYAQRQVQLKLKGTFYNLMRYFDRLSRLDRLVGLESIRFSPQGQKGERNDMLLSADVSLLVYRSLTPEEQKKEKDSG